jgi:hypothetical protein
MWVVTAFGVMTFLSVLPEGLLLWPVVFGGLIALCLATRPMARLRSRRSEDANIAARRSGAGSGWPLRDPAVCSPFERPAFWDEPPWPASQLTVGQPGTPWGRVPPGWDPLGAAPFAWDLPEPPALRQFRSAGGPARATWLAAGMLLLTVSLVTIGTIAGWWL